MRPISSVRNESSVKILDRRIESKRESARSTWAHRVCACSRLARPRRPEKMQLAVTPSSSVSELTAGQKTLREFET